MNPKLGGALGFLVGAILIGVTWWKARNEGSISLLGCIIGPAIMPLSFGLMLLPLEKLVVPTEVDGKRIFDTKNPTYTPLSGVLIGTGLLCSGLFYVFLKYGL